MVERSWPETKRINIISRVVMSVRRMDDASPDTVFKHYQGHPTPYDYWNNRRPGEERHLAGNDGGFHRRAGDSMGGCIGRSI